MLPPMHTAFEGVTMIYVLSEMRHSTFGDYGWFYFRDRKVSAAVDALNDKLKAIEKTIKERNEGRLIAYPFLQPSQILQSISI